jgi:hypothetical protein
VRHVIAAVMLATTVVTAGSQRSADEGTTSSAIAVAMRTGRYAEAIRLIDGVLAKEPDNGLRNIGDLIRGRPDMRVNKGVATFVCDVSTAGVRLPGSANGQPVSWLFDTGANFSMISDAEAMRLGMTINDSSGRAGDLAGGSVAGRTATAERLTIGSTEMRDVTFLVTPAKAMPWATLAPGTQGIVGLPIALALERISWTSDGSCTVGRSADDGRASAAAGTPLSLERLFVVASVTLDGKVLPFTLDTGNQSGTQLWPRFGREFPEFVAKRGTKGTARLTQIGGAADHPTTVISDLLVKIGGADVTLPKVHLFSPPIGHDSSYGLLGVDVFASAREVTIDFVAMRVVVR